MTIRTFRRLGRQAGLGAGLALALISTASAQPKPAARPAAARPAPGRPAAAKPAAPPVVDVKAAAAALVGRDLDAAARAAASLGEAVDPAAHEALLDALATGLHPKVAAVALAALAARPAAGDAAVLRLYAAHRAAEPRAAAVLALGGYDDAGGRADIVAALGDEDAKVRRAAGQAVEKAKIKPAGERLLALLAKGDPAAPAPIAAVADAELARLVAEQLGTAPDALLAQTLGQILKRADFGPEPARVQVVRALAKIPGPEAINALTDYLSATPEKPPRQSRREAEALVAERLGGGK